MSGAPRHRVAFLGTPETAVPSLELVARTNEVVVVVTQPDRPRGRSSRPEPSPVKVRATELGLPVAQPQNSSEIAGMLSAAGPMDVALLVAFGQLIRPEALGVPRRGFLNLHFSILPRWRGAAPVQRAIMAGDERVGVTVMVLDEGLDTGPTVATWATGVGRSETGGAVLGRLAIGGAELLVSVLDPFLQGRLVPTIQPDGATTAPRLEVADRWIDWTATAVESANRVRALSPRPGAATLFLGEPFKVLRADPLAGSAAPGKIELGNGVRVGTGAGMLELVEVQPSGRKRMSAVDWVRGLAEMPDRFG
jgi:methionyl-tRNA formyltransferase